MKPIVFTRHARQRMQERFVSEAEVLETLNQPDHRTRARHGAWRAVRMFPFHAEHRGVFCRHKQVEVRYLDEPNRQVILTVISRFIR